jgi:dihydroorotate dehydrogenase
VTVYERLVRPALFRLDPEAAHDLALRALGRMRAGHGRMRAGHGRMRARRVPFSPPGAARTVFGVRFPNPVGLAAGMDKDGRALHAWPALGFGFVEVGTVTRHPQPGNDRPRLFRLPASEAIVNRMGFNNAGAAALAARLAALCAGLPAGSGPLPVPLGISLGKSRVTPLAEAVEDYVTSLRALRPYGDYFAVNVSSPNTPGLRQLQDRDALDELLGALTATAGGKPLLVKVAPDLSEAALDGVVEVCLRHRVAGLIATNTTISREGVDPADRGASAQPGGLSGRPLRLRARDVVGYLAKRSGMPIIGVGGIMDIDDAQRLVDAGASLVQLYTGLVYRGPALVRRCVATLADGGTRDG